MQSKDGGRLAHLHNVVWITIVLHPALVNLVDEPPATGAGTLQNERDVLENVLDGTLLKGSCRWTRTIYLSPPVKKAPIRAPVQQYTWMMKVACTR